MFIKNNGEFHNSIIYNLKKVCLKKLSKINNKTSYLDMKNCWTYLSWVWSRCLLSLWCYSVWVCLYYRCFFSFWLLMWRWNFGNYDEKHIFLKYFSFFSKYFSFFSDWLNYCDLEKSVYKLRYIHEINFSKKKWFKMFRKSNYFLFSDRKTYAFQITLPFLSAKKTFLSKYSDLVWKIEVSKYPNLNERPLLASTSYS